MTRFCDHSHVFFRASPLCKRGQHRRRATLGGASLCCAVQYCVAPSFLIVPALPLRLLLSLPELLPPVWLPLLIRAVLRRAVNAAGFDAVVVGEAAMAAVAVAAARGCRCGHVVLGIVVGIAVVVVLVGSAASAVGVVRRYSRISV